MVRLGMLLLPCVFMVSVVWPLSSAYTDTEARERVAKLDARVDVLTNEVLRLRDHVGDLRSCEGGHRNVHHDGSDEDIEEGGAGNSRKGDSNTKENGLALREVRREALPSGDQRLTVQFWTNAPGRELTVAWLSKVHVFVASFDVLEGVILTNVSERDPGLMEAYVDLAKPHKILTAILQTYDLDFSLQLNGSFGGPQVEKDLQFNLAEFQAAPDIVYTRGQNASFTMKMGKGVAVPYFLSTFVNLKTRTLSINNNRQNGFLNISSREYYLDSKEFTVTLHTSEQTSSGVISMFETKDYDNGIILDIYVRRNLYFHPSDQNSPFPEGFLQFDGPVNHNGIYDACDLSNPEVNCFLLCEVYGENIATFTSKIVTPDGRLEDLSGTDECITLRSRHSASSNIQLNPEKYGLGRGRVICTATNKQGGFVEQVFHVQFYRKADILKNETQIAFLNDSRVDLVCTAGGNPAPEITFQVKLDTEDGVEVLQPDVEDWVGDKVVASVTLTSTPLAATCTLRQNVTGLISPESHYSYPFDPAFTEQFIYDYDYENNLKN